MVLFAHITSKVEGDKHQDLMTEKGGRGFPYLVVMDAEGEVVARPGSRDVAGFSAAVEAAGKYVSLRSKEEPTVGDRVELLGLEIDLGKLDLEQARAKAGAIEGMDDAQKARVEELIFPLEVRSLLPKTRNPTPEQRQAAGKAFAEMFRAGRVPTDEPTVGAFFSLMLDYAEAEKDLELFRAALGKLSERFGANPQAKGFFDAQDARLKKLEAEAGEEKKD